LDRTNVGRGDFDSPQKPQRPANARVVLEELFRLLEDYAPAWYTEEHHNRIVAALLEEAYNHDAA
jgi:hypothetical protein